MLNFNIIQDKNTVRSQMVILCIRHRGMRRRTGTRLDKDIIV